MSYPINTLITALNPFKAVSFSYNAIKKVLDDCGYLMVQTKYDGLRCNLIILPCEDIQGRPAARLLAMSRTYKLIPALRDLFSSDADRITLGKFLAQSLYPEGIVLDGEALIKGVNFDTGSGILRRNKQVSIGDLQIMLYGVLSYKELSESSTLAYPVSNCVMYLQCEVILHQLKEILSALSWFIADNHEVYDMDELEVLYQGKRKEGFEGLVIKDPLGHWKRGKKTGWWKMKPEDTIDGKVIGVNWGTIGLSYEGQVIGFQVLLENGVVVDANNLTDDQRAEFTSNELTQNDYYLRYQVEVSFMEMTEAGSLRHPSFKQFRGLEDSPTIKS